MRQTYMAFAIATILLLAGCSGGKEAANPRDYGAEMPQDHGAENTENSFGISEVQQPRKEFVIVREIVRQHGLQTDNEKRMEAITTALKAKFPLLPDKGKTEDEQRIYREAESLFHRL